MNDERLLEVVPLAAIGVLDGEERSAFESQLAASPAAQGELEAYRELVGRLGLATSPSPPAAALRERVLRETRPEPPPRA